MKWLIVEDALKDRKGHWAEYIETFRTGLQAAGDQVTILADREAEGFIVESLKVDPVLPSSIWHKMSDGSSVLRRYLRVPTHALRTISAMKSWLRRNEVPDLIFVPTVLVHHLLAWFWLIRRGIVSADSCVLLFFPNLPLRLSDDGVASWTGGPTTKLLRFLFKKLAPYVASGKVILAVETEAMRLALAQLTGLNILYLPHPVHLKDVKPSNEKRSLTFACYGAAREEKGSDIYQLAIERFLSKHPTKDVKFVIQWIDDFVNEEGTLISLLPSLLQSDRVQVIRGYFKDGEYAQKLAETDVMVLPYRRSSYQVRVSRVVIEAILYKLPVICTAQTTLSEQVQSFGSGVAFREQDIDALVSTFEVVANGFDELKDKTVESGPKASEHFSVINFRKLLLDHVTLHN